MIKRCFSISFTSLAHLSLILFSCLMTDVIAKPEQTPTDVSVNNSETALIAVPKESVLYQIPQTTLGLVYCPNLRELNNRIDKMVMDLTQEGDTELLAMILANAFGTRLQRIADLEEIGLDLNKDFAVFFTNLMPMKVSAIVHLTDPETIKRAIAEEAEISTTLEHKGVTYWSSTEGSGNFVILENVLVYSQEIEVCKNVIDIHKETKEGIIHNPDYSKFLTNILKGTEQLGVFIHMDAIMHKFGATFDEVLKTITNSLEIENDPLSMGTSSLIIKLLGKYVKLIKQLQFVSISLQLQDMDIQLNQFFKFKNDSAFLNGFKKNSVDMIALDALPNRNILNAGFQGSSSLLVEISSAWFDVIEKETPEQQKHIHPLFQDIKKFYASLADRWYFSMNFENSTLPGYLFVYELNDERNAKKYINEVLLEKLHNYNQAYAGKPLLYKGFEIKNIVFPNFKIGSADELPADSEVIPTEWHWYYAFSDGKLFWTMGTKAEYIKTALDRHVGIEDKFSDNPSYQKLVNNLGTDNNVFVAFSPIIAVRNFVSALGKADLSMAAALQMFSIMFDNLPENYSVGFSAKAENTGINAKLLSTLSDFKQLFQMFDMIFRAEQMQ